MTNFTEYLPHKIQFKRPGLRILKTGLSVFICFLIAYLRGRSDSVFFSVITAIICLRNDVKASVQIGIDRMIGTAVGGVFGLIFLRLEIFGTLSNSPIIHELLMSLVVMLLIWFAASFNSPGSAVITAIVFLSIVLNHGKDINPEIFALNRIIETFIGILVALIVNRIPPRQPLPPATN